ncbi:cation transporter [Candidatus Bathyarchaeota archaeon A05DMB-4]|nr:cation transporter [Candidatus Bathyarchaeota archaeon A05DMB-4]
MALVIIQLTAYLFTNVLVLLAQALEMLSDILVSTFLLISTYWSHKPADEFHMFGHGRGQNVAALVSATILISFMSLETFREAIPQTLPNCRDKRISKPTPRIGGHHSRHVCNRDSHFLHFED